MKKIIVTVTNNDKRFNYDVELPTNLEISKLTDDLIQTLHGANPEIWFNANSTKIFDMRLMRNLDFSETLETAGVWNGDILILKESRAY